MLHPTPDMLEAIYELLRMTPPFRGWKLPHADDVEFHVRKMKGQTQADCCWNGNRHVIRIASNKHATLAATIATMAHEMVHLHLDRAYPNDRAHHGRRFNRLADLVCKRHTFDRGQF